MFFHRLSRVLSRRAISVSIAAVVAALALVAAVIPSHITAVHATSSHTSQPKPTIVLVHGAWADGSSWNKVVRRLQHDGYTVDVPPNPLRGLASDSAYLSSFLQTITGPIVLVGHSYGGAVITNAATGNAQVKALVFIDAFIPDQGDTVIQLVSAQPGSHLAGPLTQVFNFGQDPGLPAGDYDLYVKPNLFPDAFANGLPPAEAAVLAATQRPLAAGAVQEQSGVPAWKTIPSWCLIGTADHVIPPAEQMVMCQRPNFHTVQVDAPHLSMIAHPGAVTDIIETAARATG
jgi:pimeloyl-ACP methyl ester carboxylesterase